jgi:hypothetical protein
MVYAPQCAEALVLSINDIVWDSSNSTNNMIDWLIVSNPISVNIMTNRWDTYNGWYSVGTVATAGTPDDTIFWILAWVNGADV